MIVVMICFFSPSSDSKSFLLQFVRCPILEQFFFLFSFSCLNNRRNGGNDRSVSVDVRVQQHGSLFFCGLLVSSSEMLLEWPHDEATDSGPRKSEHDDECNDCSDEIGHERWAIGFLRGRISAAEVLLLLLFLIVIIIQILVSVQFSKQLFEFGTLILSEFIVHLAEHELERDHQFDGSDILLHLGTGSGEFSCVMDGFDFLIGLAEQFIVNDVVEWQMGKRIFCLFFFFCWCCG